MRSCAVLEKLSGEKKFPFKGFKFRLRRVPTTMVDQQFDFYYNTYYLLSRRIVNSNIHIQNHARSSSRDGEKKNSSGADVRTNCKGTATSDTVTFLVLVLTQTHDGMTTRATQVD